MFLKGGGGERVENGRDRERMGRRGDKMEGRVDIVEEVDKGRL